MTANAADLRTVIARRAATKQSGFLRGPMDCFAKLAMRGHAVAALPIRHDTVGANPHTTVVARLDRAIQYPETIAINREAAAYRIAWSSVQPGDMTDGCSGT